MQGAALQSEPSLACLRRRCLFLGCSAWHSTSWGRLSSCMQLPVKPEKPMQKLTTGAAGASIR